MNQRFGAFRKDLEGKMSQPEVNIEKKTLLQHSLDILRLGLIYGLAGVVGVGIFSLIVGWRTWMEFGDALQYGTILALILGGSRYFIRPALPRLRRPKPEEVITETEGMSRRRYDREQRILDENLKQFLVGVVSGLLLYLLSKTIYAFLV